MAAHAKKSTKHEEALTALTGAGRKPFVSWENGFKLAFILVLLLFPVFYKLGTDSNKLLVVFTEAGLFAILTTSVGLVLGQAGQLSFGHTAFYGVGAYVCGILAFKYHVPSLAALVIGGVAAGVAALLVGRPVLKLKYFYLALATMALVQIFLSVVNEWKLVGGTLGFGPVKALNLFGFALNTPMRKYYMVWVVALLILLFVARALKYRVGRALRALCVSEIASSTLGVRNASWKLKAFVYNAVFCGLAGGLFGFAYGAVSPQAFTFAASVLPIVMMLVGGDRYPFGWLVGAILIAYINKNFSQQLLEYNGTVYSVLMVLLLLFLPVGLFGLRPKWAKKLWSGTLAGFKGERLQETAIAPPVTGAVAQGVGKAAGEVTGLLAEELARQKKAERSGDTILRVENVSVQFGGLRAVNDVSLEVKEGSITALIGPNGAGKTTLFNAISRLQQTAGGRVWLETPEGGLPRDVLTWGMRMVASLRRLFGQKFSYLDADGKYVELTKLDAASAARLGMARTFQNLRLFVNMSVLENVLVGCHRHEKWGFWGCGLGFPAQRLEEMRSRERAMEALALVGLADQANLPAASLPYGQQRLVEIARALASEPRLLLLDEPAAGTNQSEREELMAYIAKIRNAGVTVLIVEHDMDLVMDISDEVNVLDYGKLISCGTPEAIQCDQKVISAYLGVDRSGRDICLTRDLVDGETCPVSEDMLVVHELVTSYGAIEALHGVSLTVPKGMVVTVLGANGAGKSTLLHTVSGIAPRKRGHIHFQGADISRLAPSKIVTRGICQVPEGRQLFPTLSVQDNLVVGATGRRDRSSLADDIAYVYELFPILGERRKQDAGTLSGGEQQMLAIGRALTGKPSLLLLDEPSMGLAPLMVERIFEALAKLNQQGLTMLMVEQNAEMALSLAHLAVVLQTGNVVLSGPATQLRQDDRVRASYLGGA